MEAGNAARPSWSRGLTDLSDMPYRSRRPVRRARLLKRLLKPVAKAGLGVWRFGLTCRDAWVDARESWSGAQSRVRRIFAGSGRSEGRAVAIYAHFSPYSGISEMVARQVRDYARLGFRVVFVSAAPRFTQADFEVIADSVEVAIHRRNFGLDFGSWTDALALRPGLTDGLDELLLVNDSVLGPLHPLDGPLAQMRAGGEGLFGMTDSVQHAPHLQSYFLLARGDAAIADLADFLAQGRLSVNKRRVVKRFEIALSGHMRDLGHRVAALWNYETLEEELLRSDTDVAALFAEIPGNRLNAGGPGLFGLRRQLLDLPLNPVHHFAGLLVRRCGFPFLKTELVQHNPQRILDAVQWRMLVPRDAPVSVSLLEDHLASLERPVRRRAGPRTSLPQDAGEAASPEGAEGLLPDAPAAGLPEAPAGEPDWRFTLQQAWARTAEGPAVVPSAATLTPAALASAVSRVPLVLSFSHDDYAANTGGVQNVIHAEQQAFAGEGLGYLHLSPVGGGTHLAADAPGAFSVRLDGTPLGTATPDDLARVLAQLGRQNGILATIIHHFAGHAPEQVLALHRAANARQAIVWLHDFSTLCPNPFLLRNDIAFCDAPPPQSAACGICVYGTQREAHMERLRAFFEAASPAFLAPSRTALSFWQARMGLAEEEAGAVVPPLRLVPLPAAASPRAPQPRLRIAHLGTRTSHKGWPTFAALAQRLAGDDRYDFLQLGLDLGLPASPHVRHVPVEVGPGRQTAMADTVASEGVDVVINWSGCFETFSFTAHEALAGGAFLISHPEAGNVPAVVAENAPGQGLMLADAEALADLFETGRVHALVAAAPRARHLMVASGASAEWLLARRAQGRKRSLSGHG